MNIVELREVWKAYKNDEYVLKGVNLIVKEREFIAIRGKSGAGKSTLLRIIGLLDKPSKGDVIFFKERTYNLDDEKRANIRLNNIGFMFQSFNLIPHLTMLENIEVPMYLKGFSTYERKKIGLELLEKFGLKWLANKYPKETSLGEQQRVAAIRSIVNKPKLLLADEPTSYLDDENSEILLDLFKSFNKEYKMAIIIATTSEEDAKVAMESYLLAKGILSKT